MKVSEFHYLTEYGVKIRWVDDGEVSYFQNLMYRNPSNFPCIFINYQTNKTVKEYLNEDLIFTIDTVDGVFSDEQILDFFNEQEILFKLYRVNNGYS